MIIRGANIKDIDNNLLKIYIDGFRYHYNNRIDVFQNKTDDELKENLINTLEENKVIVLEKEEKIIGYISYYIKIKYDNILWINELVIDEHYRNKGYGTMMLKEIIKIAKEEKCKRVEFNCWSFNENAIKLYESLGFREQRKIMEINI